VPASQKKFTLIDSAKDISVELRCLPVLDLVIIVPTYYPSNGKPLLLMESKFYEPFKEHLYSKLNEKWYEDMLVLYEFVCFIKDDFIDSFFEEVKDHGLAVNDKTKHVEFKYNSSSEFQKVFDASVEA
jgi:hypothetical protein